MFVTETIIIIISEEINVTKCNVELGNEITYLGNVYDFYAQLGP